MNNTLTYTTLNIRSRILAQASGSLITLPVRLTGNCTCSFAQLIGTSGLTTAKPAAELEAHTTALTQE